MDVQEFEKFYWATYPELLGYARSQTGYANADDVVSNTFLTLWLKDLDYPTSDLEHRKLRALAYAVVHGHVQNDKRSQARQRSLTEKFGAHLRTTTPASSSDDLESEIANSLEQLTEKDREIVLLFHAGFSTREIAEILHISPHSAQKRQSRAKSRLRAILENERGLSHD
jgi:RNA polymerase sigma factor (sigma-70 family)